MNFALYPAYSRVSRGALCEDAPFPTFRRICRGIACKGSELNAGFLAWRQNEEVKILINNKTFSRVGIKSQLKTTSVINIILIHK